MIRKIIVLSSITVSAIFLSCGGIFGKDDSSAQIRAVRLISTLPVPDSSYKAMQIDDTMMIYYHKNQMLIRFSVLHNTSVNGRLERGWITHRYFATDKNSSYGFILNPTEPKVVAKKIATVDFLQGNTVTNFEAFYSKKRRGDSLVGQERYDKGQLLLKYVPKLRLDDSFADSTLLYLRKDLEDVEFSFSKAVENEQQMKLSKIRIIFNGNPGSNLPFVQTRREIMFSMDKVKVENREEIFQLFKRFNDLNKASLEGK